MDAPTPTNIRNPEFRYQYANTFAVQFSGGDVQIKWGIQLNPGTGDPSMEEIGATFLTHSGAKLLAEVLTRIIADYETTSAPIPIDPQRIASIDAAIAQARQFREEMERQTSKS